jgi:hypothetical protein
LNKSSVENYLPWAKILEQATMEILPCHEADLLRVFLLAKYGGVWADVSSFSWKPIDTFLARFPGVGYFVPMFNWVDRQMDDWFMISKPGDETIATLLKYLTEYVFRPRAQPLKLGGHVGEPVDKCPKEYFGSSITGLRLLDAWEAKGVFPYFYFHYIFNAVLHNNKRLSEIFYKELRPIMLGNGSASRAGFEFCFRERMDEQCLMTKFNRRQATWMKHYDTRLQLGIDSRMEPISEEVRYIAIEKATTQDSRSEAEATSEDFRDASSASE